MANESELLIHPCAPAFRRRAPLRRAFVGVRQLVPGLCSRLSTAGSIEAGNAGKCPYGGFRVREFVVGEASHEDYFLSALTRWGVPARDVAESVPLTATAQFIALQYRLAHLSVLDYLAGSAVLEVDPGVYARQGDPYEPWETAYGLDPEILAPVREHIREDVDGGHAQLFRTVASGSGLTCLATGTAVRVFQSARTVFEASRLWQRGIYEHYYMQGRAPMMARL